MNKYIMRLKFPDTQAGIKGLKRDVSDVILSGSEDGFLFEIEWIHKAERLNVNIETIPVTLVGKNIPSGIPGGSLIALFKNYLTLLRGG